MQLLQSYPRFFSIRRNPTRDGSIYMALVRPRSFAADIFSPRAAGHVLHTCGDFGAVAGAYFGNAVLTGFVSVSWKKLKACLSLGWYP